MTLTLRIAEGRSQFRPGEIIPLELEFSSVVRKRFVVDGATYDRSGRLAIDDFRIDPADAVTDPMTAYFAANGAGIGGGLSTMGVLGEKPFVVKLDLNEWVRFERPGMFQLTVRSRRVTDEGSTDRTIVPVESDTVSFEILARDPGWEATQLSAARTILDAPGSPLDRRKGCRMMRFLGSDAAVNEMTRRFGTQTDLGCDVDYAIGLFAARSRVDVVRQMESGLVAPDQAVTTSYLRTLAALSVYENHPEVLPDPSHGSELSASREMRRRLIDAALTMYSDILIAALPQKTDRARAIILAEREAILSRASSTAGLITTREQLATVFVELPASKKIAGRILESTTDRLTHMPCRPQLAILAYFLRVDDRVGKGLLERALASRVSTGCRTSEVTSEIRTFAGAHGIVVNQQR